MARGGALRRTKMFGGIISMSTFYPFNYLSICRGRWCKIEWDHTVTQLVIRTWDKRSTDCNRSMYGIIRFNGCGERETQRETSINVSSIESEIIGDLNECSDDMDRKMSRERWLERRECQARRGERRGCMIADCLPRCGPRPPACC